MRFSTVTGHGGADDGEEPTPEDLERWHRAREQPDNEVPAVVPVSAVLGRTDAVAVVLSSVEACSTGFGFEVSVRLRQPPSPHDDVYGQVMGNSGAGGQLLLGVEFADGRRGSTIGRSGAWPPQPGVQGEGQSVSLSSTGGGGGGRRVDQRWWVSPLPPDGPLRVVVRWDAQGLDETVTELDGTAIAAAGRRAVVLWPWEPESPDAYELDEPPRPDTGWFAQS